MKNIEKKDTFNVTLIINNQQGIKNIICIYNFEQLNNWKVWHKVIQNQLEISRDVVICLNGFITMELWTFPLL